MPVAITLACANRTAAAIDGLRREADDFVHTGTAIGPDYPAHITLAIYDRLDPGLLADTVSAVAAAHSPVSLHFSVLRYFEYPEGDEIVLWAAPDPDAALVRLHAAIHARIPPKHCHRRYRPRKWVPHCTIAQDIAAVSKDSAKYWAEDRRVDFRAVFDRLDGVRFRPAQLLCSAMLS